VVGVEVGRIGSARCWRVPVAAGVVARADRGNDERSWRRGRAFARSGRSSGGVECVVKIAQAPRRRGRR